MYEFSQRCEQLFRLLQDDLSKEIFKARLLLDVEPSISNAMRVLCLNEISQKDTAKTTERLAWKETVEGLEKEGKKIFLYGAGLVGSWVAALLQYEKIDFYGFCDRRADSLREVLGKPVVSPEYLFHHEDECCVILTVGDTSIDSVRAVLKENHFSEDHIICYSDTSLVEKQYFDFPSLYRRGTAFVDAGCFDCSTDIAFSKWCGGEYSKIFAFEPDPNNYLVCKEKGAQLHDLVLIPAGVADRSGTAEFVVKASGASTLRSSGGKDGAVEQTVSVQITTIDEAVGGETVGMIKMDIEGAEFDALRGAEQTIRRDKPLLALCVYHRPGDTLAFMDYLNKLVPEYRFWLRHYTGPLAYETVLYASVNSL